MKTFQVIAMLVALAPGCKDSVEQPQAADPYQRWLSYHLHHYTMTQIRSCYCVYGSEKRVSPSMPILS